MLNIKWQYKIPQTSMLDVKALLTLAVMFTTCPILKKQQNI